MKMAQEIHFSSKREAESRSRSGFPATETGEPKSRICKLFNTGSSVPEK